MWKIEELSRWKRSSAKASDTAQYSAYVCHVRGVCVGSVFVWNQSGGGSVYERCGDAVVYTDH